MAGRERSAAAACSDGDSHLEDELWLSFESKQSHKSSGRRSEELQYGKQTNFCFYFLFIRVCVCVLSNDCKAHLLNAYLFFFIFSASCLKRFSLFP